MSASGGERRGARSRALAALRHPATLGLAGGVCTALATPPLDVYPAALGGLAFLWLAVRGARPLVALMAGGLWAGLGCALALRFMPRAIAAYGGVGLGGATALYPLLVLLQALPWALALGCYPWLRRRVPAALAFAVCVWLALTLPAPLAWSPAALVAPWPWLVESADVLGERGTSALLALVVVVLARLAFVPAQRRLRALVAPAFVVAAFAAHAWAALAHYAPRGAGVPVGVVQAAQHPAPSHSTSADNAALAVLKRASREAELEGAELIVWPAHAFPFAQSRDARMFGLGPRSPVGEGVRGPVVTGLATHAYAGQGARLERFEWDAVALVGREGTMGSGYERVGAIPFVEGDFLGLSSQWFARLFGADPRATPGGERRALGDAVHALELAAPHEGGRHALGVLLGLEVLESAVARRSAANVAPVLMLSLGDSASVAGSGASELAWRAAILRAVELRRDLVRADNLGVSGLIDARGVVRARLPSDAAGSLVAAPLLRAGVATAWVRYGDLGFFLAWIALVTCAHAERWARARRAVRVSEA